MTKLKFLLAFCVLLSSLLLGCSSSSITSTIHEGVEVATPTNPSHGMTPVVTSFNMETRATRNCATTVTSKTDSIMKSGSLILALLQAGVGRQHILSANTTVPEVLMEEQQNITISPFSGTLVWLDHQDNTINFLNPAGQILQFPGSRDWGYIRQWILDDQVLISPLANENSFSLDDYNDQFFAFSALTASTTLYSITLPGLFEPDDLSLVAYNSLLTHVVYPARTSGSTRDQMVLRDIQNEINLWSQWGWRGEFAVPDWHPEADQAVLTAQPLNDTQEQLSPELFAVSLDGQAIQLTNFSDSLEGYRIINPRWSPDGRYVAFVFVEDSTRLHENRFLYTLDIETGIVIDYCVETNGKLFWSPDSTQIAFELDTIPQSAFILDTVSGQVQKLNELNTISGAIFINGWVNWLVP